MEVNAIQQMLSRLRQVQEDLQQQVNGVAVEASAGGGMVTVKMNGQKQIVDLRIEPEVFASKDQEMLQDLVRAAVNEASRRVDEELASQMKNLAGNIPGISGMKIPGVLVLSSQNDSNVSLPFFPSYSRVHTLYFTNWPLWTSYSTWNGFCVLRSSQCSCAMRRLT